MYKSQPLSLAFLSGATLFCHDHTLPSSYVAFGPNTTGLSTLFSATEAGAKTRLVRGDLIQCVSLHSKFLSYVGGGGAEVDGNINIYIVNSLADNTHFHTTGFALSL